MARTSHQVHRLTNWQGVRFIPVLFLPVIVAWAMASSPGSVGAESLIFCGSLILVDTIWPSKWQCRPSAVDSAVFRGVLRIYAVLHLVVLFFALAMACKGSWLEALSLAVCMGLIGGTSGHAAAHALGHSPDRGDKFLAWALMTTMGHPHFMVEHYRGHHPRAATWEDPTSAHEGESFWRFFPRSVVGQVESARVLETHRLEQRHLTWRQSPLAWAGGFVAGSIAILLFSFAWTGLLFCFVHWCIAICLLEAINYIEHYGLYRDSLHGFHLPFVKAHAWNAKSPVSGTLLFDRPIHSDHHISPWKPLGMAGEIDGPQLPTGYAGCILLAMVPIVWIAVMHHRLIELQRLAAAFESECNSIDGHLR